MDKLQVLFKCITLLHRENELGENTNDNSKDLVRTIVTQMNKNNGKPILGGESDTIGDVINLVLDMVHSPDAYDKHNILHSLEIILKDKGSLYSTIEKIINMEIETPGLKRSILSLRINLNNYYKETEITNIINKASYQLKLGKLDEGIQEFTSKLIINLEALNNATKVKDAGIVDEIDISEDDGMDKVLTKVKNQTNGDGRLKTGWKEFNTMLNGGMRLGETVLLSALQHNFKSGSLRSLFAQLCMYNKPVLKDKNKKPLNVFISFEDDADIIAEFFYVYLYYSEKGELPNMEEISTKEISSYIRERLTSTGYNVKILRVNPSEWTYKSLFNKILEYEASGFELNVVVTDYLSKLPTTGCDTSGPMGTAFRDMLTRARDFTSSKGILFINAHQLSTDAKQLIRNGIPAKDLVKEIANKGFYEGSRQLDQVVDLEIHQHIACIGKKYYLTVQRGKRRYPEIIDDDKKYFMLPFPKKIPCIPPNITVDGEYIGFKYSPEDSLLNSVDDDNEFQF